MPPRRSRPWPENSGYLEAYGDGERMPRRGNDQTLRGILRGSECSCRVMIFQAGVINPVRAEQWRAACPPLLLFRFCIGPHMRPIGSLLRQKIAFAAAIAIHNPNSGTRIHRACLILVSASHEDPLRTLLVGTSMSRRVRLGMIGSSRATLPENCSARNL